MIENGTQYTNHQIDDAIKNQIYPNASLWTNCTIRYAKQLTSSNIQFYYTLLGLEF